MFTGILLSISMLIANDSAVTAFVLPSTSGLSNLSNVIRHTQTSIFYRDDGDMEVGVEQSPPSHDTKSTTVSSPSSWKHIIEKRVSSPPINGSSSTTSSSSPSDFQSRMKRIIAQNKKRTSGAVASYRPSNIKNVISLEEFANVIEKGRRESKVVVVRFIATWCKVRYEFNMKLFMFHLSYIRRWFTNTYHIIYYVSYSFCCTSLPYLHFLDMSLPTTTFWQNSIHKPQCYIRRSSSIGTQCQFTQRFRCWECTLWTYLPSEEWFGWRDQVIT